VEGLDIARTVADVLVDKQAEDILILDLREVTTFTDYFVICSAMSHRQLDALQYAIREALKQADDRILAKGIEGSADSGWVLVDFNSVIVHLFDQETRQYYQIEELWKHARAVTRIR